MLPAPVMNIPIRRSPSRGDTRLVSESACESTGGTSVMTAHGAAARPDWLTTVRRYLFASACGHLGWEIAQMPLYALWRTGTTREITVAVLHCTLGDLSIALVTLSIAIAIVGSLEWPNQRSPAVMATVVIVSAGYTIYSEYVNTVLRQSWAYGPFMPTLPWLGTGLSPLAQWIIVPSIALTWASRRSAGLRQPSPANTRPPRDERG